MSNSKKFVAKNGLQTQNIDFVSNNESNTVVISVNNEGLLSVNGNIKLSNSLYDSNNSFGVSGQILLSSETGVLWTNAGDISGLSGYSGFSGYSGYSGYSGESGYSGFSGESGYSGISGYSGFSGISGFSGESGYSGFSGINW